jgi:hypothetical protein
MATFSNTPRPAYVWDADTSQWYPIGTGAHSHTDIPLATATAKGDLIAGTGSAAVTNRTVGADGSVLIADSTQASGLNWAGDTRYAGKNKIINGDFSIWQRGTSFGTSGVYSADRWNQTWNGSPTLTVNRQAFTPGTAPVAGYEAQYFLRSDVTVAGSGATYLLFAQQRVEDVRTFAGQTVTFSFWAKSSTSSGIGIGIRQNFGSSGSAEVYPTAVDLTGGTTTSSWRRLVYNITFPSISGKTIGAGSYIAFDIYSGAVNSVHQIDIWGVQAETGSVATPFVPAGGGSQQAELALCQRYYQLIGGSVTGGNGFPIVTGYITSGNTPRHPISFPVPMRAIPTMAKNGTWNLSNCTGPNVPTAFIGTGGFSLEVTSTATGIYYAYPDSADDYISASAEL